MKGKKCRSKSSRQQLMIMNSVTNYVIPVLISMIMMIGLVKNVNVFDTFIEGAKEGFQTSIKILPALVALMAAVATFKASGALDILTHAISPVTDFIHVPEEVLPLALLRPISGSGSLAMLETILSQHGPDSFVGRVASVIQGSTETTFYTIAVYYGAVGIKNTRHTVFSSVSADLLNLIMSCIAVRLVFGN